MKPVKQRSDKTWVYDREALAVYVRKLKNKTGERSELSMIQGDHLQLPFLYLFDGH